MRTLTRVRHFTRLRLPLRSRSQYPRLYATHPPPPPPPPPTHASPIRNRARIHHKTFLALYRRIRSLIARTAHRSPPRRHPGSKSSGLGTALFGAGAAGAAVFFGAGAFALAWEVKGVRDRLGGWWLRVKGAPGRLAEGVKGAPGKVKLGLLRKGGEVRGAVEVGWGKVAVVCGEWKAELKGRVERGWERGAEGVEGIGGKLKGVFRRGSGGRNGEGGKGVGSSEAEAKAKAEEWARRKRERIRAEREGP